MPAINKVIIAGNLTKDPEVRYTATETAVSSFSVAINESYKDRSGEWKKSTAFFNIVAWGKTAEYVGKYLRKGNPVFIEGKLQTRSYENKEGHKVYVTEINASSIQSLSNRNADASDQSGSIANAKSDSGSKANADDSFFDENDNDAVPF